MPTFYGPPSDGTVIPEQLETALAADIAAPESAIGGAIADVVDSVDVGQAGRLVSTLSKNVTDATLVVLGDSTGNETTEWVYRTVQWLGEQFPKYTVSYRLWDDAAKDYLPAEVIQTGTGTRTFHVYNGSHPGASYDYVTNPAFFHKILPTASNPTAVVISLGYNSTGDTYAYQQLKVSSKVLGTFPGIEYVVTAQPPKAQTDADSFSHLRRQEDTRTLAMSEGWGLIDATRPFIDYGDYSALIQADGIHPTAEGSGMWVEQVKRYFGGHRQSQTPAMPTVTADRIVVPPSQFFPYVGAPEQGFPPGIMLPAWFLDPATNEMIVATVDIPSSWKTVDVQFMWTSPAGATGSVVWRVDWYAISGTMHIDSGKNYGASTNGNPIAVSTIQNTLRVTNAYTRERFSAGRPLAFRVSRVANDAADTSPDEALFHGLVIKRAE